ncbi:hypothetical protein Mx4_p06 [Myxococcus phage Mx4]|nr:hypothetical protein Mx4_p06 [Myxococcus phage Mx4]
MGNCDGNDETTAPRLSVVRGGVKPVAQAAATGDALLTVEDVCALLKVERKKVLRLKDHGHLPCVRLPGECILRFRRIDVDAFIARCVQGGGR